MNVELRVTYEETHTIEVPDGATTAEIEALVDKVETSTNNARWVQSDILNEGGESIADWAS